MGAQSTISYQGITFPIHWLLQAILSNAHFNSYFTPTCASCSTTYAAPGVVSVRGESTMAICRRCHGKMSMSHRDIVSYTKSLNTYCYRHLGNSGGYTLLMMPPLAQHCESLRLSSYRSALLQVRTSFPDSDPIATRMVASEIDTSNSFRTD